MAFLSCEEMLAAARSQKITLAEAVLRSDLEESRLTEAHSRAAMRHLWQVMQATSQEYDPAQRSRSGLSGGDAAKVEQAWQQGRLLGDDYLAAVTAEALKTAECNACMKRIVAAPTAGSCGVLPAVLLPLARAGRIELPTVPADCGQNAHMFYIKLRDIEDRSRLIAWLKEAEILAVFHYIPLHSCPAGEQFGEFRGEDRYTTQESERLVRLPLFYNLSFCFS